MPTIQSADLWRESGRYDAYGRRCCASRTGTSARCCSARPTRRWSPTSSAAYAKSYRDLPRNLYHIQWKFRDEVRPRFGVMRGREFLMKDAYSFDLTRRARAHSYARCSRLSAHLRAHGPEGDPDARRYRPDRRRPQPRVHHPGRDRRERRSSVDRPRARLDPLAVDPDDDADLSRWSTAGPRSTPRPTRCTTRPPGRRCPSAAASPRAASRSATSSTSAPSIRADGPQVQGRTAPDRGAGDGQLRHRRLAPGRRADRGQPRRGRHHLAGRVAPFGGGAEPQAGDAACDAMCEDLYARWAPRPSMTTAAPSAPA
jgi:prolyl-tRNA synthetase